MRIGILFAATLVGVPVAAQVVAAVVTKDTMCVMRKGNPGATLWKLMREALEGKDGEAYAAKINGTDLPKFQGTVLAVKAGEFLVSVTAGKTAEVVVRLTRAWKGKPLVAGTPIEFSGKIGVFEKEPFRLTFAVDPGKVELFKKPRRDEGDICTCYPPGELGKFPR